MFAGRYRGLQNDFGHYALFAIKSILIRTTVDKGSEIDCSLYTRSLNNDRLNIGLLAT